MSLFQNKATGPGRSQDHVPNDVSDHGSDTLVLNNGGQQAEPGYDGDAPSQAATKTTLDDLMATLQKLEEEEKFPTARKEKPDKNEKPLGWCKWSRCLFVPESLLSFEIFVKTLDKEHKKYKATVVLISILFLYVKVLRLKKKKKTW